MRFKTSLLALRAILQEALNSPTAANHTRMELSTTILHWSEFFEIRMGQGSSIRPIQTEPGQIEKLLEGVNHWPTIMWLLKRPISWRNTEAKSTAIECEDFLSEVRDSVATCITDHTIIKIISPQILPTYTD